MFVTAACSQNGATSSRVLASLTVGQRSVGVYEELVGIVMPDHARQL